MTGGILQCFEFFNVLARCAQGYHVCRDRNGQRACYRWFPARHARGCHRPVFMGLAQGIRQMT